MNLSAASGGYNSGIESTRSGTNPQAKGPGGSGHPDSILQDVEPSGQNEKLGGSSGGIQDLKDWLRQESNKKYEESLKKLALDTSKI